MSEYISRNYLREKWSSLKWDMEKCLNILDESEQDSINLEDASKVFANVSNKANSIIAELRKSIS